MEGRRSLMLRSSGFVDQIQTHPRQMRDISVSCPVLVLDLAELPHLLQAAGVLTAVSTGLLL